MIIIIQQIQMSSIREIYYVVKHMDTHGIEGYHVDSKYYDPLKMKKEKQLESSKDRVQSSRPANISKKTTFIDEVQKQSAKVPGPCSYQPKQLKSKSKTESLVPPSDRKTIFDEITHLQQKQNFPPAGLYDRVQVDVDKQKLHSNISKAEKANYIDSSMREAVERPSVGEYNAYHGERDKRAPKWMSESADRKEKGVKLPPVGTYSPLPLDYQLFESELGGKKRYNKSCFNKEERFKKSRDKPLPFYNILSEWGMKNKMVKKDILARISLPNSNRSVYH